VSAVLVLASTRTQVADYISTVIYVYSILIFVYIIVQLLFAAGLRPSYSRTLDTVLSFLREVVEPYLRIFRGILPSFGGLDFSPVIAILALQIFNVIVVQTLIHG